MRRPLLPRTDRVVVRTFDLKYLGPDDVLDLERFRQAARTGETIEFTSLYEYPTYYSGRITRTDIVTVADMRNGGVTLRDANGVEFDGTECWQSDTDVIAESYWVYGADVCGKAGFHNLVMAT